MRVLRLLVRGLSYSGSAKALCVEPSTVKYHVINMLQKTGLENKLQPAIAASEAKPVVELAERRLSSLYRQGDCENRPMPISRFSCNGAAMQQSNLPYKRKPKAYAAHLPASGFIYPEKGLEHTCPILLRDAAACVCNTQHSAAFLLPDRDMHRTAGGIVFDAVFNQIKEQAVDQGVAALDADILTFLKEGDAPALCQRGQVSHDLISQRGQLDMIFARNRLQIAHFQQCADKAC